MSEKEGLLSDADIRDEVDTFMFEVSSNILRGSKFRVVMTLAIQFSANRKLYQAVSMRVSTRARDCIMISLLLANLIIYSALNFRGMTRFLWAYHGLCTCLDLTQIFR